MSIWLNDGSVVIDADGNIIICDDCPCTGTGTGSFTNCNFCTTPAPWQIAVVVPALSNTGSCAQCANYAGTYVVKSTYVHPTLGSSPCIFGTLTSNPASCPVLFPNPNLQVTVQLTSAYIFVELTTGGGIGGAAIVAQWVNYITAPYNCTFNNYAVAFSAAGMCTTSSSVLLTSL